MSEEILEIHYDPKTGFLHTNIEGFGEVTCDNLAEAIASTQQDAEVTKTQSIGKDDDDMRGEFIRNG